MFFFCILEFIVIWKKLTPSQLTFIFIISNTNLNIFNNWNTTKLHSHNIIHLLRIEVMVQWLIINNKIRLWITMCCMWRSQWFMHTHKCILLLIHTHKYEMFLLYTHNFFLSNLKVLHMREKEKIKKQKVLKTFVNVHPQFPFHPSGKWRRCVNNKQ